jgi:hypothetical protein
MSIEDIAELEPDPLETDLSPDEMTLDELERRAELRRQEEVAAILARWDAMDAMDGPAEMPPPRAPEPYHPRCLNEGCVSLPDCSRRRRAP